MSQLTVYPQDQPEQPQLQTEDFATIQETLGAKGIRFERWRTERELPADADNDSIVAAYRAEIDRLMAQQGYQTFDVISMNPEHPQKDELRQKFLAEHRHSEDEVRFFVRGCGLFVLHLDDRVYALRCEKDDLISVPANTRHWFDMGPRPAFTAIRLFNNPQGWVANFTGDDIASRFPRLES